MDCVGSGKEGGASSEETVPLPEYERLSQSARLPDDADPLMKSDAPAPPAEKLPQPQTPTPTGTPKLQAAERKAQKPAKEPPSPPRSQQPKPAAWRLIEYVRSRNKSGGGGGGGGVAAGCSSSDGDSKSSDGEKEAEVDGEDGGGSKDKKDKKKKRSSWLPDPDRRWPVQGFY
ncbi:Os03g0723700 [Oryza sativa Japonica Group]|nr:hypothetical protein EE612_020136 [Oryza sativa]BAS86146.1 Os03g0723700 [Oryza sativa Japonica Group]